MTIFGVPWGELELQHVEAFLAEAGGEPLTWEAKGTELPRPASIAKHVGGFANAIEGGYLLLGFEREDGTWRATGLDFPGDDPPVWVAAIVRDRLRPVPRIDVRDWPAAGKRAAVVQVEPVAEPPCVTTDGQIFQRVAGATVPVQDPSELRRLYERGETVVAQAEAAALRSLDAVIAHSGANPAGPTLLLGLAVAPVGTATDIAAEVFGPGTEARLREAVNAMPGEPLFFEERDVRDRFSTTEVTQDAVTVATTAEFAQSWRVRVAWDGSAAVLLRAVQAAGPEYRIPADDLFEAVRSMASVAEQAARDVGGHGRAHVALGGRAWLFSVVHGRYTRGVPDVPVLRPIQRWADGEPWLDGELLDGMKRELLRACGIPEWEPAEEG